MKKKERCQYAVDTIRNRLHIIDMTVFDMRAKKPVLDKKTQKRYVDSSIVEIYELLKSLTEES